MNIRFVFALFVAGSLAAHVALAGQVPGAAPEETVAQERVASAHESDAPATHDGGHSGPGAMRWLPSEPGSGVPYAFMLINFALLMAIYVKAGREPLAAALEKRRGDFLARVDEADRLRREAEARAESYKSQLATLAEDLASARTALEEAGRAEQRRIIAEANERATRMKEDAAFLVRQEALAMRGDLQRKTAEAAIDAAAKLLATHVSAADQERLAEAFLSNLSASSLETGANP